MVVSSVSSSSSSSGLASPSVSAVSSIVGSSSEGRSSGVSLLGPFSNSRLFWYSSHSPSTLLSARGSLSSKLASRHSKQ